MIVIAWEPISVLFRLRIRAKPRLDSGYRDSDGIDSAPVAKLVKIFTTVTTRRIQNSDEPKVPDLRDVIASQVTKALHHILPGLFAQMKDEILEAVDQRIDMAFTTRGSTSGNSSQAPGRNVTFKDFMACQPPLFEGRKDPIACFRWVAAVEGAFRTSGCPGEMKVFYVVNLLRNAESYGGADQCYDVGRVQGTTGRAVRSSHRDAANHRGVSELGLDNGDGERDHQPPVLGEITFLSGLLEHRRNEDVSVPGVLKTEIREFVATSMCKSFDAMVEDVKGKRKAEQEPVPVKKFKGQRSDGRKDAGRTTKGSVDCQSPCASNAGSLVIEAGSAGSNRGPPGHIKPNCPQLVGAAAAETPASTPLMITDGSTGKKSGSTTGGCGRVFQLTAEGAEADPDVVAAFSPENEKPALVLFDTGATWSFVLNTFDKDLQLERDRLASPLVIDIATEEVRFGDSWSTFYLRLYPHPVSRIDVIVGVDGMFRNRGTVDCAEQLARIQNSSGGELIVYGEGRRRQLAFSSITKAREYLRHRCAGYLAYAVTGSAEEKLSVVGVPNCISVRLTIRRRTDKVEESLNYTEKPVAVLEWKVKQLRNKEIGIVKVQWQHRKGSEWIWEPEADMREVSGTLLGLISGTKSV
ncbi:LOW QUALITY PROTEIN: hypothetical protein OSB04_028891 [Centaurea solstitialis]|uniref:Chromo domain-containing protein n=1 Tax=Centaurea solstitialis TaxID=347529 RepID=A0AA38SGN5_9ASTR|nr:LOW QUALITY PROTEIN: hypothetical protein OSB04_028891 [Centaurea solstitialis]